MDQEPTLLQCMYKFDAFLASDGFHLNIKTLQEAKRGSNQATVKCYGSFTKLLTSLIAEWYGVNEPGD